MRKALRIILWIIAFILFPITAGLYFVWPSKILKQRLSPNWRMFWWITYGFVALVGITSKIWFYVLVPLALSYSGEPFTTCENVQPSDYHTAEDFRKLTGVEFPELEMVDSLYYDENIIRANTWNEYKFVAKMVWTILSIGDLIKLAKQTHHIGATIKKVMYTAIGYTRTSIQLTEVVECATEWYQWMMVI